MGQEGSKPAGGGAPPIVLVIKGIDIPEDPLNSSVHSDCVTAGSREALLCEPEDEDKITDLVAASRSHLSPCEVAGALDIGTRVVVILLDGQEVAGGRVASFPSRPIYLVPIHKESRLQVKILSVNPAGVERCLAELSLPTSELAHSVLPDFLTHTGSGKADSANLCLGLSSTRGMLRTPEEADNEPFRGDHLEEALERADDPYAPKLSALVARYCQKTLAALETHTLRLPEDATELLKDGSNALRAESVIRAWYGNKDSEWDEAAGEDITSVVKNLLEEGAGGGKDAAGTADAATGLAKVWASIVSATGTSISAQSVLLIEHYSQDLLRASASTTCQMLTPALACGHGDCKGPRTPTMSATRPMSMMATPPRKTASNASTPGSCRSMVEAFLSTPQQQQKHASSCQDFPTPTISLLKSFSWSTSVPLKEKEWPRHSLATMPYIFPARQPERTRIDGNGSVHRVLCYGDQLTAGYSEQCGSWDPYGRSLASALDGLGVSCEVSVCGMIGQTVETMHSNIDKMCMRDTKGNVGVGLRRLLSAAKPPELVVIVVDVADDGSSPNDLFRLHAVCHGCGIPTIAVAPPVVPGRKPKPSKLRSNLLGNWARYTPGALAFLDPGDLSVRGTASASIGGEAAHSLIANTPSVLGTAFGPHWDADGRCLTPAGSQALGDLLGTLIAALLLDGLETSAQRFRSGAVEPQPPLAEEQLIHKQAGDPTDTKQEEEESWKKDGTQSQQQDADVEEAKPTNPSRTSPAEHASSLDEQGAGEVENAELLLKLARRKKEAEAAVAVLRQAGAHEKAEHKRLLDVQGRLQASIESLRSELRERDGAAAVAVAKAEAEKLDNARLEGLLAERNREICQWKEGEEEWRRLLAQTGDTMLTSLATHAEEFAQKQTELAEELEQAHAYADKVRNDGKHAIAALKQAHGEEIQSLTSELQRSHAQELALKVSEVQAQIEEDRQHAEDKCHVACELTETVENQRDAALTELQEAHAQELTDKIGELQQKHAEELARKDEQVREQLEYVAQVHRECEQGWTALRQAHAEELSSEMTELKQMHAQELLIKDAVMRTNMERAGQHAAKMQSDANKALDVLRGAHNEEFEARIKQLQEKHADELAQKVAALREEKDNAKMQALKLGNDCDTALNMLRMSHSEELASKVQSLQEEHSLDLARKEAELHAQNEEHSQKLAKVELDCESALALARANHDEELRAKAVELQEKHAEEVANKEAEYLEQRREHELRAVKVESECELILADLRKAHEEELRTKIAELKEMQALQAKEIVRKDGELRQHEEDTRDLVCRQEQHCDEALAELRLTHQEELSKTASELQQKHADELARKEDEIHEHKERERQIVARMTDCDVALDELREAHAQEFSSEFAHVREMHAKELETKEAETCALIEKYRQTLAEAGSDNERALAALKQSHANELKLEMEELQFAYARELKLKEGEMSDMLEKEQVLAAESKAELDEAMVALTRDHEKDLSCREAAFREALEEERALVEKATLEGERTLEMLRQSHDNELRNKDVLFQKAIQREMDIKAEMGFTQEAAIEQAASSLEAMQSELSEARASVHEIEEARTSAEESLRSMLSAATGELETTRAQLAQVMCDGEKATVDLQAARQDRGDAEAVWRSKVESLSEDLQASASNLVHEEAAAAKIEGELADAVYELEEVKRQQGEACDNLAALAVQLQQEREIASVSQSTNDRMMEALQEAEVQQRKLDEVWQQRSASLGEDLRDARAEFRELEAVSKSAEANAVTAMVDLRANLQEELAQSTRTFERQIDDISQHNSALRNEAADCANALEQRDSRIQHVLCELHVAEEQKEEAIWHSESRMNDTLKDFKQVKEQLQQAQADSADVRMELEQSREDHKREIRSQKAEQAEYSREVATLQGQCKAMEQQQAEDTDAWLQKLAQAERRRASDHAVTLMNYSAEFENLKDKVRQEHQEADQIRKDLTCRCNEAEEHSRKLVTAIKETQSEHDALRARCDAEATAAQSAQQACEASEQQRIEQEQGLQQQLAVAAEVRKDSQHKLAELRQVQEELRSENQCANDIQGLLEAERIGSVSALAAANAKHDEVVRAAASDFALLRSELVTELSLKDQQEVELQHHKEHSDKLTVHVRDMILGLQEANDQLITERKANAELKEEILASKTAQEQAAQDKQLRAKVGALEVELAKERTKAQTEELLMQGLEEKLVVYNAELMEERAKKTPLFRAGATGPANKVVDDECHRIYSEMEALFKERQRLQTLNEEQDQQLKAMRMQSERDQEAAAAAATKASKMKDALRGQLESAATQHERDISRLMSGNSSPGQAAGHQRVDNLENARRGSGTPSATPCRVSFSGIEGHAPKFSSRSGTPSGTPHRVSFSGIEDAACRAAERIIDLPSGPATPSPSRDVGCTPRWADGPGPASPELNTMPGSVRKTYQSPRSPSPRISVRSPQPKGISPAPFSPGQASFQSEPDAAGYPGESSASSKQVQQGPSYSALCGLESLTNITDMLTQERGQMMRQGEPTAAPFPYPAQSSPVQTSSFNASPALMRTREESNLVSAGRLASSEGNLAGTVRRSFIQQARPDNRFAAER